MTTSVLVPDSLCREAEDRREATRKIGYVARAATIFNVNRLTVFPDPDGAGKWEDGFVATVLRYAATPPHLRKEAWGKRDELEYVGVLPPLRVRSQTGSGSEGSGSLRQGIVTEVGADGRVRVNCGLQHPISLPVPSEMEAPVEGERVTVRVSSRRPVRAKLVDEPQTGYTVDTADVDTALERSDAGLTIAASRHGESLSVGRLGQLVERRDATGDMTVVFGAPERGLPAIFGLDPDDAVTGGAGDTGAGFDLWLNTVPNQGSEVVRTEEAMFATLASLTLTE